MSLVAVQRAAMQSIHLQILLPQRVRFLSESIQLTRGLVLHLHPQGTDTHIHTEVQQLPVAKSCPSFSAPPSPQSLWKEEQKCFCWHRARIDPCSCKKCCATAPSIRCSTRATPSHQLAPSFSACLPAQVAHNKVQPLLHFRKSHSFTPLASASLSHSLHRKGSHPRT